MKHPYSRTLIELAVKRALKSIEDDPKRSIRNMVDLGAYFSGGRFQKRFLEKIQVMLKNEKSAYYKLVQDTVSNVAHERLLTFGMNLGYNSCTYGAKRIRELEAAEGHNIPWAISVDIGSHGLQKTFNRYASLVDEGEELGIYTWLFFMEEERQGIWSLIEEHPDSAFVLFCESYILTTDFMNRVSEFNNVMLMVEYHASASEICMQLRNRHLLYGVYYRYSAEDKLIPR